MDEDRKTEKDPKETADLALKAGCISASCLLLILKFAVAVAITIILFLFVMSL